MLHRQLMNAAALGLIATAMISCGGGGDGLIEPGTPVFTSLSISPTSAGLFTVAPENTVSFTATPRDQNSQPMSGLGTASFSTSNAGAATVNSAGLVTAVGAGSAQITASLTSAGTTKTAFADVTVQDAADAATVTAPQVTFSPNPAHISVGGTVTWTFAAIPHTVNFSDPGAPANVAAMSNASESRTFLTSGTFAYVCTIHAGMSGSVVFH